MALDQYESPLCEVVPVVVSSNFASNQTVEQVEVPEPEEGDPIIF